MCRVYNYNCVIFYIEIVKLKQVNTITLNSPVGTVVYLTLKDDVWVSSIDHSGKRSIVMFDNCLVLHYRSIRLAKYIFVLNILKSVLLLLLK